MAVLVKEPELCFHLPQSALGVLTFFWLPALKCFQLDHKTVGLLETSSVEPWEGGRA